ncbi:serine protease [Micromonospora tulbaghiae]|uniref:S1 family peptidase n=1 Tax=Micromonospora tulbaghiae TaxID=479978 RepID=UPI0036509A29
MTVDQDTHKFLGRVLDSYGRSIGTCFQVSPGVIVTAAHVVRDAAVITPDRESLVGQTVNIVPLASTANDIQAAQVTAVHPSGDVAVLQTETPLPGSVSHLAYSDIQVPGTKFSLTGCATMAAGSEAEAEYRSLTTLGEWTRYAVAADGSSVGAGTASGVEPGMSGSPLLRKGDNAVIGVMSRRHNSDEWSRHVIWLVRIEDLEAILPENARVPIDKDGSSLQRNRTAIAATYADRERLMRDEFFVSPLAWQVAWVEAVAALNASKIVVVSAPSGYGSTTFAEQLLAREADHRLRMARLDVGDWDRPSADVLPLHPWHGYILDLQDPDHDRPTAEFISDLDAFAIQLHHVQSCMIVVVREDLWSGRPAASLANVHFVTLTSPPDPVELVERYFEISDPIMVSVIQSDAVKEHLVGMTALEASDAIGRIKRSLPADFRARHPDSLAGSVAEILDSHADELDTLFGDDSAEGSKAAKQYEQLNLDDRCLLLALSFSSAIPVSVAEKNARELLSELRGGLALGDNVRPDQVFAKAGIRGRLRRVRASVDRGDSAELIRPSFGVATINYVWDNYSEVRRPLVKWICSGLKDESLRMSPAQWVSSLIRRSQDVDFIRNDLRSILQNSSDKSVLVEVLLDACLDHHMRRRGERVLYDWAHQPGNQDVVIKVAERLFLETRRPIALRRLQRVADSPRLDLDATVSLSTAFENLLNSELARDDFLATISDWLVTGKSKRSTKLVLDAIIRSGGAEYLLRLGARESPHLKQLLAEMLLDPSAHPTIIEMVRSSGRSDEVYRQVIEALGGAAKEQGLIAALFRLSGALDVAADGRKPVDDLSAYLEDRTV